MPAVGVIAEDNTDVETIRVIIRRVLGTHWGVKGKSGKGCARARKKATAWLKQFGTNGVHNVIILHDLDLNPANGAPNDLDALRVRLEAFEVPRAMQRYVCIPVEELEAWFWACSTTLEGIAKKPQRAVAHPETIRQPKEKLIALSRREGRVATYSTNDNPRLAEHLNIDECAKRCPSFAGLLAFLQRIESTE